MQRYVNASNPPGPALQAFLGRVAGPVPGGTVIEVVSGPGRNADHLESRGLSVQRTDATAAFVDRLRADDHDVRPLDVRTDPLDVRTDPLGGPYDAVFAQAVLRHLSREQLAAFAGRALAAVRRGGVLAAVRLGGVLAATVKEEDGEAWTTDKLDAPRWFTYLLAPALRVVFEASGWSVISLIHVRGRP